MRVSSTKPKGQNEGESDRNRPNSNVKENERQIGTGLPSVCLWPLAEERKTGRRNK